MTCNQSVYFQKIAEYYGKEMVNTYTKEDFWRDYPPQNQPFAFPWEEEYHQRVIEQVRQEVRDEVRDEAVVKTLVFGVHERLKSLLQSEYYARVNRR